MFLNWLTNVVLFLFLFREDNPAYGTKIVKETVAEYRWTSEHLFNGSNIDRRLWFFPNGTIYPQQQQTEPKLFPEDKRGDRIIDQLMYIPQNYMNPKKKYILINIAYIEQTIELDYGVFKNCPVNRCFFTKSRSRFRESDVILVDRTEVLPQRRRTPGQLWIFRSNECPKFTRYYNTQDAINWTMTYRDDSDIVFPYGRWIYYDPKIRQKHQTRNYAAGKTKMVAWVVSNCGAFNERLMYAIELSRYISVDIYGVCGTHKCPTLNGTQCFAIIEKQYKFYLSFENSNCHQYITEKLFRNAFNTSLLPIVMGARQEDYHRVAPEGSYIHVEQFSGPRELAVYLKKLDGDDDLYNTYFRWKGTGELLFETYSWCRLCAMLHGPRRAKFYFNFPHWWKAYTCITTPWNVSLFYFEDSGGVYVRLKMVLYLLVAINLIWAYVCVNCIYIFFDWK